MGVTRLIVVIISQYIHISTCMHLSTDMCMYACYFTAHTSTCMHLSTDMCMYACDISQYIHRSTCMCSSMDV